MKLDPELKPDNWNQFTPEEKKEFLSLTPEEKAFFKLLELDEQTRKKVSAIANIKAKDQGQAGRG